MPDRSDRLDLPFLMPSQAQKHVTHNEALERLDMLVQLVVEAFDETSPPALPDDGAVYATGTGSTGAWAGRDGQLAAWQNGAWTFVAPATGWRAWGRADGTLRVWTGAAWQEQVPTLDNLDGVGIGTSADATNRLAVAAAATLFSHDGAGHQVKINKAAAADTASLLFQTNWSGHAEMGLAGTNDFAVKVSDNGSTWATGFSIDAATGAVSFPQNVTLQNDLDITGSVGIGTTDGDPSGNNVEGVRVLSNGQIRASKSGLAPLVLNRMEDTGHLLTLKALGNTVGYFRVDPGAVTLVAAEGDMLMKAGGGTRITMVENGEVGIGTTTPQRQLHVGGALRLDPGSEPASPAAGDIYFDDTTLKLRCHDGTSWHDLF